MIPERPTGSYAKALLHRFDATLKGDNMPLQLLEVPLQDLPLPLLVREQRLHPTEALDDGVVLVLQALQAPVELVEVAEDLAKAFVMGDVAL